MKAEHINPFLNSLANTFKTMLACEIHRGELHLKDSNSPSHPISGVIGLSGKAVGTVVINLSEEVAIKAASAMLMTELTEMNEDVLDAGSSTPQATPRMAPDVAEDANHRTVVPGPPRCESGNSPTKDGEGEKPPKVLN